MNGFSRRDFLKQTAVLGGAAALSGFGAAHAQETTSQMAIAKGATLPEQADTVAIKALAEKLTRRAIEAVGGMKRFVSKGDVVWIKPNMAWNRTPEQGANTNPEVVATLVTLCLEAGAKQVKVGDNTCNDARQSYPNSGIEAAAKGAGADIVYIDGNRFKDMAMKGERLKNWELYPEIVEADFVLNVPVVKHHSISEATMCMKNYMGIAGGKRGIWHQDLATCLCDVTAFMKPRLCVLDAVRVLTANGPTGGRLSDVKLAGTIAVGTDIVALDAFGATLLGHKPEEITSVAQGHARGLGEIDYNKLAPKEVMVS